MFKHDILEKIEVFMNDHVINFVFLFFKGKKWYRCNCDIDKEIEEIVNGPP